jgi:hypothetical protein
MKLKKILGAGMAAVASAGCITAHAQDETDALRFSNNAVYSTARSIGIGGAVGALGGDFASLSVNPAGIGVYRRSEFTFTPSIKVNNANTNYQGVNVADAANRFNINNLGVVFTSVAEGKRYERSKWKAVSFGIGFNRIADFNRNYTYKGSSNLAANGTSGAEVFSIDANRYPGDTTDLSTMAGLGYESFLIDYDSLGAFPVTFYTPNINQQRTVNQRGGMNDIAISFGGNYDEKLMLGLSLGIPTVRFKREISYSETDATGNPNNYFDYFKYSEKLSTRGSGINLKLGAIYKPIDWFRVGVAIHTPTYFTLKDEQDKSLETNTENFKAALGYGGPSTTKVDAPTSLYEYTFVSPWRASLSAAGIFGKYGFISADYEYVDYASSRFTFELAEKEYETFVNQTIKNTYQGVSILRLGLEGRIEQFSLRLGFGYMGSPYKNTAINAQQTNVSAGIGFRFDNMFLDLGYVRSLTEAQEQPYALNYKVPVVVPTAVTKYTLNNVALTFGVKF